MQSESYLFVSFEDEKSNKSRKNRSSENSHKNDRTNKYNCYKLCLRAIKNTSTIPQVIKNIK